MAQHKNDRAVLMAARLGVTAVEENGGDIEEARALLGRAEALNPRQPAVPHLRARLARVAGEGGQEEALLHRALAINPLYYPARVDLAKIAALAGMADWAVIRQRRRAHKSGVYRAAAYRDGYRQSDWSRN